MKSPIIQEAKQIIDDARARGIVLRLLGGLAVALRCPSVSRRSLERTYPDMDFFGVRNEASLVKQFFLDKGFVPNKRFNAIHGATRLMYKDPIAKRNVDVFLDEFKMSHRLRLVERLLLDDYTISISDLLLTKLQVVEINEKDFQDIVALLLDYSVDDPSIAGDQIDPAYIASLCSRDWGLERTIILNVEKLKGLLSRYDFDPSEVKIVQDRISNLLRAVRSHPKTLRWKFRNLLGERKRWYDLPEAPIRT